MYTGEFQDLQFHNINTYHPRMCTLQDHGSRVFENPCIITEDFDVLKELEEFSLDSKSCELEKSCLKQSTMPSPEMFTGKRGNIQPQAQTGSQKPNRVLTPRKLVPSSLNYDTKSEITPPSLCTKPVYDISPEEMAALDNRMQVPFSIPSSDQNDQLKSKLGDIMWCDQTGTEYDSIDDGTLAEKLNFKNRVNQDRESLSTVVAFQHGLDYLQGETAKVVDPVISMPTDAMTTDDGLTQPQPSVCNQVSGDATENYPVVYRSESWDTDAKNYQKHLTSNDMDLLLTVIDLDVQTSDLQSLAGQPVETASDDQPVIVAQEGTVSYGTANALRDLARNHQTITSRAVLTGIVTRKEFGFIRLGNLQNLELLGEGSFGRVTLYKGPSQKDKKFVIKQLLDKEKFRPEEAIVGSTVDSPYLLKTFGLLLPNNGGPQIIMDYGGESLLLFAQKHKLQDDQIWNLTNQMCKGLKHLADYDIIHFDIKPENMFVLIDQQGLYLRLGDFGSAKLPSSDVIDYSTWTPEYMAPEMIRLVVTEKFPNIIARSGNEITDITTKCDIFPAGLVVLFMYLQCHFMLNTECFTNDNPQNSSARRLAIMFELTMKPDLLLDKIPTMITEPMRSIVCDMLQGWHEKRASAQDVINKMEKLSQMKVPVQPLTEPVKNRPKRTAEKIIVIGAKEADQGKGKYIAHKGRRRSTRVVSTKGGKKIIDKVEEEVNENQPSELENKVMEQPSQIRKRMVKGILKNKLQKRKHTDSNPDHEQMDTKPCCVGKQMRISMSSEMMSPISNNSEWSLNFENIVAASGPVCQAEDDGMTGQAIPGNIPNLDFDCM